MLNFTLFAALTDSKVYMELFALSDKYELNINKKILDSLQKFKISHENFIYSAAVSNSYRGQLQGAESTELLLKCLKFYLDTPDKEKYETSQDILEELMEVGRSTLTPFGQLSGYRNIFGEFLDTLCLFYHS